jgi:alpha-beta hydrolase superfamily lysophospholipase
LRVRLFLAAACISLIAFSGSARAGHVYLLRGFANVFSTGLDTLQEKLQKRGFTASVHSYLDYDALAAEATRLEKQGKGPVIIIGHSLGANDAISMAETMNKLKAPVALVVLFGPTEYMKAPANVARVVNYYQSGVVVVKGPGFKGSLSNVNLEKDSDINHFNIEKSDKLHAKVIAMIAAIENHAHAHAAAQTPLPPQKAQQQTDLSKP